MQNPTKLAKYIPTIGIECHIQLNTHTKLFSGVPNDITGVSSNDLISHICLGMPGALPVLNEKAVEYACRIGFSFGVKPQKVSYFERKHYFYPDLPKGYQITQLTKPIVTGGHVEIKVEKQARKIRINRVQIEEDAGKNIHPKGKDYSLVDLNRAGTPLLEIVSEPDIHSAVEAKAFARELFLIARYSGVSDANMYLGNMRFDVNVSLSSEKTKLGTRTETKNINSFRAVEKAVEYEIQRQELLLNKAEDVVQETRGWDDAKQKTFSQRGKEEAHDYRYFPEPDVPPVVLSDAYLDQIKKSLPILPAEIRERLKRLQLTYDAIETLLNNNVLLEKLLLEAENGANETDLKRIADWLLNVVLAELDIHTNINRDEANNFLQYPGNLTKLSKMVESKKISASAAKEILATHFTDFYDPELIAKKLNLTQVSDENELEALIMQVIGENPVAVSDIEKGELKARSFLVGKVMQASKGKANPAIVQEILNKVLER
jgi:aspartyl-tRNA(Asn)/glutamyl-tRNA(Gln) amidotransferase subunit B